MLGHPLVSIGHIDSSHVEVVDGEEHGGGGEASEHGEQHALVVSEWLKRKVR